MKSFSIGLIFGFSLLALVVAAPTLSPDQTKEGKVGLECNITNPVQRNPIIEVSVALFAGQKIDISQEEKCYLNCFLQKVGFLDQNANIKNGAGLVNFTLRSAPELAKYSDVLIAVIFDIARSNLNGNDDKCQKAFINYYQYSKGIIALAIANGLETQTGIREEIVNAMKTGQPLNEKFPQKTKQFLGYFDLLAKLNAPIIEKKLQEQTAKVQSQIISEAQSQGSSELQAQASNVQSQGSSLLQQQAKAIS